MGRECWRARKRLLGVGLRRWGQEAQATRTQRRVLSAHVVDLEDEVERHLPKPFRRGQRDAGAIVRRRRLLDQEQLQIA